MPIASAAFLFMAGTASGFSPSALWSAWPQRRFVATSAPCLRHAELVERLFALEARYPGRLKLEEVGRSVQGRKIHLVTLGSGPRRILLWSQMHGDEPSATPALLDLADTLLASDEPEPRAILEGLTLLDGADAQPRRGRALRPAQRAGDRHQPRRPPPRDAGGARCSRPCATVSSRSSASTSTTRTGGPRSATPASSSTISLLAVSGDREGTLTPGRARAKRVCSAIARALEPFVPGGIGRYDEDWNPRAFGDNVTAWGTPVVLIESGGIPPGRPLSDLTRLNYVALLTVLHGLVRDDLRGESPDLYESLKRNDDGNWTDVLLAGGRVLQPWAGEPYRADVAFDVLDDDPLAASCAEPGWPGASRIREVGDGRLLGSARRVDVDGPPARPRLHRFGARARGAIVADGGGARRRGAARGGARSPGTFSRPSGQRRWRTRPGSSSPAGRRSRSRTPARRLSLLEIAAPPGSPSSPALESALDALPAASWRRALARPDPRRASRRAGRGGHGRLSRSWPLTPAPPSWSCARARRVRSTPRAWTSRRSSSTGASPGERGRHGPVDRPAHPGARAERAARPRSLRRGRWAVS